MRFNITLICIGYDNDWLRQWLTQNMHQILYPQQIPHISPSPYFVRIWVKIYRVITAPHCSAWDIARVDLTFYHYSFISLFNFGKLWYALGWCCFTFPYAINIWCYTAIGCDMSWWRHQMETFSALLAICAENSPASGEFPAHRPVTRSFHVFFDLCLNKRLRKQSWGWWFETSSRPLWRHGNERRYHHCNEITVSVHCGLINKQIYVGLFVHVPNFGETVIRNF